MEKKELKKEFFEKFKDKIIRFREDDGSFSMSGYELWEWIESKLLTTPSVRGEEFIIELIRILGLLNNEKTTKADVAHYVGDLINLKKNKDGNLGEKS